MVEILVWWVLPAVTTLLALGWAAWVRRGRRPQSDARTVEGYARFLGALEAPAPDRDGAPARNRHAPPTV